MSSEKEQKWVSKPLLLLLLLTVNEEEEKKLQLALVEEKATMRTLASRRSRRNGWRALAIVRWNKGKRVMALAFVRWELRGRWAMAVDSGC